jgi:outer membrane lipoprotein carrier protein
MRKSFILCALATCFYLQPSFAQNDPKAKAVLDGVSKKVKTLKTLKAGFAINLTGGKGGKVTDTKKGTVTVKGDKYHVELIGQEIICDGKTIWTYNKDAKEVQVTTFNPAEQSVSPAKILTPDFYEKEYRYSYKGEKKEQGKNCDVVELIPNDKTKQVNKIELYIDKSASMMAGGDYWEKNGNKYHISVNNLILNTNVPDTYFTWNPKEHAGVETVDLR